jgi:hypothetical protein
VQTLLNPAIKALRLTVFFFLMAPMMPALGNCLQNLVGAQYVKLPESLCRDYSDVLFGANAKQQEYGGVICDRRGVSYILLQRLIQQRQDNQSVWEIVKVKRISRRTQQSVMSLGCSLKDKPSQPPIIAVVSPMSAERFKVQTAWSVDLNRETFVPVDANRVSCQNPLL